MQLSIDKDITANRSRNHAASKLAHEKVKPNKAQTWARIIDFGITAGEFTSKDLAAAFDVPLHFISGRVSELKAAGILAETDSRRDGCSILYVAKFA